MMRKFMKIKPLLGSLTTPARIPFLSALSNAVLHPNVEACANSTASSPVAQIKKAADSPYDGWLKLCRADQDAAYTWYDPTWLRFNCQCAQCRQPHSNQRILDCSKIPNNVRLDNVDVQGDKLLLKWSGDDHRGHISLKWLRDTGKYEEFQPKPFEGETLPRFDFGEIQKTVLQFYESVLENGFAIVYNLPTEPGTVKTFVETVFRLPVQRTIYGEIFDVIATPNPINVAYSNAELKPHIDLAYYESPPGLQLLHCLRFHDTVKGGESTLVDGFAIAEELRHIDPEAFDVLSRTVVTFEKIHFDREWPVHMRYRRPHIVLNFQEEVTGIFWAPQFEGPLLEKYHTPHSLDAYYRAYKIFTELVEKRAKKLQFRLNPGEMTVFNNRRMLHGRKAFSVEKGVRHFQGCYVNIDEFKSQAQIARVKNGLSLNTPRVANQSH